MKKSLIFTIVAVVLAIATLIVGALLIFQNFAEPTVVIGSAKGLTNDVVEIPITIKNNPGIWGGQIIVDYDSKSLDFDAFVNGDAFEQCLVNDTGDNVAILVTHTVTNKGLENSKNNGEITTLKFKIKPASKKGQIDIKFNSETNFCNADQDLIEFKLENGFITVK